MQQSFNMQFRFLFYSTFPLLNVPSHTRTQTHTGNLEKLNYTGNQKNVITRTLATWLL